MDSESHESQNQDEKQQWILRISDDLRIRADVPHNWIIEQRAIVKSGAQAGKERWVSLGYYGDISLACASVFEKHLDLITRDKGKRRVKDLLQELPECVSKILNACNELKTHIDATRHT